MKKHVSWLANCLVEPASTTFGTVCPMTANYWTLTQNNATVSMGSKEQNTSMIATYKPITSCL